MKIINLSILVLLLQALSACQEASSQPPDKEEPTMQVVVTTPERVDYHDRFTLAGEILPDRDVTVSSRLSETVRTVPVQLGERVSEGDVLATLDDAMLSRQIMEAEANLQQKLAGITKIEKLFEKKAASQQQYILAKTTYDMAEAQLLQLKEQMKRTVIASPLNGYIVEKFVEEGELVNPGQALFRIVNTDKLKVRVNLSEADVSGVHTGDRADVLVSACSKESIQGEVSFVSRALDPMTRTLPVEILIRNRSGCMSAGMTADATFTRGVLKNVPVVPTDSVVIRKGKQGVWIVEDGKAIFRVVLPGNPLDDRIPVVEGLEGEEQVVVRGHRLLEEGDRVTVQTAP